MNFFLNGLSFDRIMVMSLWPRSWQTVLSVKHVGGYVSYCRWSVMPVTSRQLRGRLCRGASSPVLDDLSADAGPWRRAVVGVLAAWLTWSMLRTCCVAARQACQFPAFLQTNSCDFLLVLYSARQACQFPAFLQTNSCDFLLVLYSARQACQFPTFLQSNSSKDGQYRDWHGQVQYCL